MGSSAALREGAARGSDQMSDRDVISLFVSGRRPSRIRLELRSLRARLAPR
jgi:hypothetical protein